MQGGAVIRSVYLKKTYQFSYTYFVSTLYGNYIIIFGVNALFALISLLMIWIFYNTVPFVLFGFFGLLLFSMIALVFVKIKFNLEKIKIFKLARKFLNILNNILEGWEIIAKDKKLLMNLVMITVGNFILMTITFAIQFSTLDIQSNLLTILLYNCLSGVSLLISLTPGALGVREGIFFLNSNVLEITNEQIMQLALLDRGITILTLFFWFVVLSMWKLMSTKIKN
jgi:uncharacterized membrane protein YbhN (UPF0104 family)